MLRATSAVFGLVLACACVPGVTADEVNVSGRWPVQIDLNGNVRECLFTLKQDGEKLTGKYEGALGEAEVMGKVNGRDVEFSFEVDGRKIVYTGTIDADTMEGKANYADQATGTWKSTREKIDVTGTWEVETDINGTTGMPSFEFKQEGEKISGKYKGQLGEADVTGKVQGNEIEFSFEIMGGKIVYTGTIEKDTMKGEANYADQASGTWKGKKKAS